MLNRIIYGMVTAAVLIPFAMAKGISQMPFEPQSKHAYLHEHRLLQSAISASPEVIKVDRHRLLVKRRLKHYPTRPVIDKAATAAAMRVIAFDAAKEDVPQLVTVPMRKETAHIETLKFDWSIVSPLRASVSKHFGEGEQKLSKGMIYEVRHHQPVYAPVDGDVIFAGPMREFGHVLMIEKDFNNIILVAGITRLDNKQGDKVSRGQKVGDVIKGSRIYLEFRNEGNPIDPRYVLGSGKLDEE